MAVETKYKALKSRNEGQKNGKGFASCIGNWDNEIKKDKMS
jgi:hypothetical protein